MRRVPILLMSVLLLPLLSGTASATVIQKMRLTGSPGNPGSLYVTIYGREHRIARKVEKAWLIRHRSMAAYDQFVRTAPGDQKINTFQIYNATTGRSRKAIRQYQEGAVSFREMTTSTGKTALNVVGGSLSGAPFLYIIDATRAKVVFHPPHPAKIIRRRGDTITVGYYNDDGSRLLRTRRFNLIRLLDSH